MKHPVLVFEEDGKTVKLQDGKPVYKYEDGSEAPFDLGKTLDSHNEKLNKLMEEKDRHFKKAEKLTTQLKPFKGLDPEKASQAIETVQNLDSKQLLDANGVKAIKSEWEAAAKERENQIHDSYKTDLSKKEQQLSGRNQVIFDLAVRSKFNESNWFNSVGDKSQKTTFMPQDAARIFGPNFKTELVEENGKIKTEVIPVDDSGVELVSRETHGGRPNFDEAIGILLDKRYGENKSSVMIDPSAGKHGPQHTGPGTGEHNKSNDKSNIDRISSGLESAKKSGATTIQG